MFTTKTRAYQIKIECSLRICSLRNACLRYTNEHSGHLNINNVDVVVVGDVVGMIAVDAVGLTGNRKWPPICGLGTVRSETGTGTAWDNNNDVPDAVPDALLLSQTPWLFPNAVISLTRSNSAKC